MTCPHTRLDAPDGLRCTRTDPHDPHAPGGHVYVSGTGSDVGDRHSTSEAVDD